MSAAPGTLPGNPADDNLDTLQAIVAVVAPTLGLAFGGPLAGLAFSTVRSTLSLDPDTTAAQVTGLLRRADIEQLRALQQANGRFRAQMKGLQIADAQLGGLPPRPARGGLYQTTLFPAFFAVVICVLFFLLLSFFAWHPIPPGANETVLNVMLGAVAASFTTVVSYWFGSTNASGRKDMMLYNSTPSVNPHSVQPDQP